jgi:2-polyprenyl-6-methoxyphenol hydroxylase-like FAD-dependent oxidoreductase
MTISGKSHEVVIIGAGIAGAAPAAVLARAGRDVLVLEKSETYADRVRGEALLPWGVKEAKDMGLFDALVAAGGHIVGSLVGYDELRSAKEAESAPVDMAQFAPGVGGILSMRHPEHCQALLDGAVAAGAEVRRGARVLGLEAGAAPQVSYEADGVELAAGAPLIVGADGRPSAVREALGIPLAADSPRTMAAGMLVGGAEAGTPASGRSAPRATSATSSFRRAPGAPASTASGRSSSATGSPAPSASAPFSTRSGLPAVRCRRRSPAARAPVR